MKILFSTNIFSEADFNRLFEKYPSLTGQQGQKFMRLICRGLCKNGAEVQVISNPPITQKHTGKRFISIKPIRDNGVFYKYLRIVDIKTLKYAITVIGAFFASLKVVLRMDLLICDAVSPSTSLGALIAFKIFHKPIVCIVTDIPELMVTGCSHLQSFIAHMVIKMADGYIFVAEEMKNYLKSGNKPYLVMEGICGDDYPLEMDDENPQRKTPFCLYAGLLDARYGVRNMVEGFIQANIPGVELRICGNGSYADELKEIAKKHPKIVYCGAIHNKQVLQMEREALLLVNPRPTHEDFVRYSFPSKNIEYMGSGTAVLTTLIPSMPDDYKEHVYLFETEDVMGLREGFKKVLSLSEEALKLKGENAREFILSQKNSEVQGKRLKEFFERII